MTGAHVIGTGSSEKSRALLDEFQISEFVNYKQSSLEKAIAKVDLVVDCVGGSVSEECLKVVKNGGLVISIASVDMQEAAQKQGLRGLFFIVQMNATQLKEISSLIENKVVRPVVDSVFPLERTKDAFEKGAEGHSVGRMVISVS